MANENPAKPGSQPTITPTWMIGTVGDAFAHSGSYILHFPNSGPVPAVDLFHTSALPLGARPMGGYMPQSRVLAAYFPSLGYAVILGAVPKQLSNKNFILPDSQTLRCQVGYFEDPMHSTQIRNSSIGNHSAGRPADTLPGDWGAINDLGVAVWIGRMLACLRASDLAKVEAFWGDDLLRVVGYNYEHFTSGSEDRRVNDEGEYNEVWRATPFPWEAVGQAKLVDATTMVNGKLQPGAEDAKYEPKEKDQLLVQRHLRLRGYLGDVYKEVVCLPPADLTTETYQNKSKYLGVLEITQAINGAYAIRSAKEITLEKHILIPVPKELIAPEDPLGDNSKTYKAADLQGQGPEYKLPEFVWGAEDAGVQAAQLPDYHAWFFNRYTVGGLAAHVKDWYFPNEADLTGMASQVVYDKNLKIGHKFLAPLPGFGTLVIDPRPSHSTRYYRSRSVIKQHDDGSITIEDGYGSQLMMKGGSIYLTCVGDVFLQPGRSLVGLAPFDIALRAGNSADLSAAKHDVRIKAERNLHCLAGNDEGGVGGILLESRSTGEAKAADYDLTGERVLGHGVAVKCAKSSFQVFAHSAYMGLAEDSTFGFVLDAGKSGTLYLRGRDLYTRTTGTLGMLQASDTEPDTQMFAITMSGAVVSIPMEIGGSVTLAPAKLGARADLFVGGSLTVNGTGVFGSSVATNGGYAAKTGAPFVAPLNEKIKIEPTPDALGNIIAEQVVAIGAAVTLHEQVATESPDSSPGNAKFQERVGFSFRDTKLDLKLDEPTFILYESRWQQMLRAANSTTKWDEPTVRAPDGTQTLPYPGLEGWTAWAAYGEVHNDVNIDEATGVAKARDSMTEKGNKPILATLAGAYLINVQS